MTVTPQAPVLRLRGHASGGQTQTQTQTPAAPRQPVLHLRGAPAGEAGEDTAESSSSGGTGATRRIQWAEDVVDNEGLGRKKSKVCCIYHAPKGIDESSDESSSDSDDSDSDSGDDGSAKPARKPAPHSHGHDHGHKHGNGKGKGARSPNAYEKVPKTKDGGAKEKG